MRIKAVPAILAAALVISLVPGAPALARAITVVAFGDSLMAGYELPPGAAFPVRLEAALRSQGRDVAIANAAVSGDTTSGGLARLDWSVPDGTDAVLLELGGNDALRGISPGQTRANLEAMIARLKERGIAVMLVGMLAPPNMGDAYADAFDAIYPDLAAEHDLVFYPFFLDGVAAVEGLGLGDGIHPNAQGVDVMVERFLPYADMLLERVKQDAAD